MSLSINLSNSTRKRLYLLGVKQSYHLARGIKDAATSAFGMVGEKDVLTSYGVYNRSGFITTTEKLLRGSLNSINIQMYQKMLIAFHNLKRVIMTIMMMMMMMMMMKMMVTKKEKERTHYQIFPHNYHVNELIPPRTSTTATKTKTKTLDQRKKIIIREKVRRGAATVVLSAAEQ